MNSTYKIDEDGDKYWYNEQGYHHREDGPAIEYADGGKCWWYNGVIHRENGPAVEWADGLKEWYINGELHRIDGPAVEYANGDKVWYFHGKLVKVSSQEEFERYLKLKIFW